MILKAAECQALGAPLWEFPCPRVGTLLQTLDVPAPGQGPQRGRGSPLSRNIDTNTGRGLGEKVRYTKLPFSGVQGF